MTATQLGRIRALGTASRQMIGAHTHQEASTSIITPAMALRAKAKERIDKAPPHSFLIDAFNRRHTYLRLSLTEKCNLRCRYCMPAEGVPVSPSEALLTSEELLRVARLFVREGVTKIRLTGGEPTLRKDLVEIVRGLGQLRAEGLLQLGITTNGLALERSIDELVDLGLTHYNFSLDTLNPYSFELMTRRPAAGLDKVLNSIARVASFSQTVVKINVVVMRGFNDQEDLKDILNWAKDLPIIVRFIEYMPFDGNKWSRNALVPYRTLLERIEQWFGPAQRLCDGPNDTTKHYKIAGARGSFGFITSMSEHFCGSCNRLRITADGNVKVSFWWP